MKLMSSIRLEPSVGRVRIDQAYGRVLAEDVYANVDLPPRNSSNVDGFAVRFDDMVTASTLNPIHLKIKGSIELAKLPNILLNAGRSYANSYGSIC